MFRAMLLACLLTACGGAGSAPEDTEADETPTAWPEDFETWVCGALQEMELNARPAIDDMVDAAEVLDIDGAAEAAERAADSATAARGMLELAPRWGPGQNVVRSLDRSTTLFAQGANLVHAGATNGDVAAIEDGTELIGRASNRMGDAVDRVTRLREKTGFSCG